MTNLRGCEKGCNVLEMENYCDQQFWREVMSPRVMTIDHPTERCDGGA